MNPDNEKTSPVWKTSLIIQASGLQIPCTGINTAVGNAILCCCYWVFIMLLLLKILGLEHVTRSQWWLAEKFWGNIGEVFGGKTVTMSLILLLLFSKKRQKLLTTFIYLTFLSIFLWWCCLKLCAVTFLTAEGATSSFNSAVTKI